MTPLDFVAANCAVAAGSVVQAISGVGGGFIIVPLLAWIDLSLVPAPMIFASLSLSGIMTWRERGAIDTGHMASVLLGLLPGCIVGGLILAAIPTDRLGIVFGLAILTAISVTASGLRVPLNHLTAFSAAAASGAMGASTGIGAPILALVYQHESGSRVRSTLALLYTIASVMILVVLGVVGEFGRSEAMSGALLVPGFLGGYWLANRFARRFAVDHARIAVLIVSGIAAVSLIARSI